MRSLKLVLAVSGFFAYFVGMIALSAVTTSLVLASFFPRTVPIVLVQN